MNIYIYGNSSFKEEIHKTLEHANIKFKLDLNTKIEDINNIEILKEKIIANPKDIYLIDDAKIIKKNLLNEKIKFLKPKDGIEQAFLLEHGIADTELESLDEIPKYIIKKHDEIKDKTDIQDSIIDMVDEAYQNDSFELDDELNSLLVKDEEKVDFSEDVGLNNINSDYDKENNLSNENKNELNIIDENEQTFDFLDEKEDVQEIYEDPLALLNEFDFSDNTLEENKLRKEENSSSDLDNLMEELSLNENITEKDSVVTETLDKEGVWDMDDFSQLDSLNEKDMLDALQDLGASISTAPVSIAKADISKSSSNEKVEISSSNIDDLSQLITKLLNNKTLEITIKVKD